MVLGLRETNTETAGGWKALGKQWLPHTKQRKLVVEGGSLHWQTLSFTIQDSVRFAQPIAPDQRDV